MVFSCVSRGDGVHRDGRSPGEGPHHPSGSGGRGRLGCSGGRRLGRLERAERRRHNNSIRHFRRSFRAQHTGCARHRRGRVGSPGAAQEGSPGIDTGTGEDGSNQFVSAGPTPEELSSGPVLQWTEIDPGFADLFNFESLDDGRVLARAWGIGDELVLDGERAVFTDNGIDWTGFPLPDGIVIRRIDISGDRWLAWGRPRSSDGPREVIDRVFFTDDRGANWNELLLQVPPDPKLASPYCERHLWVSSALASGERFVLEVGGYATFDAQELLVDRGLLPEGRSVRDWRPGEEGTVVFEFLRRFGFEPGVDPEVADSEPGELRFTHEELGFTAEELAALCLEVTPMRLLWSNGSTVELADGPADPVADISAFDMNVVDDVLRVQSVGNGSPASTTATFEGLHPTGVRAAGSAGVAATAFPSLGGQLEASTIGGLPRWRDRNRVGELPGVPLWLGWSADGIDWGWQSLPDAFGITEGEPWAQLAVGRDFVIARVETIVSPTPEEIASWAVSEAAYEESLAMEAPPLRWFIARVP